MKVLISSLFLLFATISSFSQLVAQEKIPLDPTLVKGRLDNGLTYYIKENKKPEKKVELRLVVKVGSIVEDEDQLGLAHMAEHMAFNGTKNFKKNDIVSYLQGIGVEFGGDLNAYTGFDETVYILPIPTEQPSNLAKGFQILEDWAHQVTYLDEDIESERAIILEESRLGKSGAERMFKKVYPELFKGSKYAERLPIGKDSIIKNFNPDAIRRFYGDWYRPDLMAVVVVGDITSAEALDYIKKHFSGFSTPASPRARVYAEVPPYQENKAMVVTDKEATGYEFNISYSAQKTNPTTTVEDFKKELVRQLYAGMMSSRFREITQKENAPFMYAGIDFESYAKHYESFSISGSTGTNDVKKGIDAALTEIERVKKFGFTEPEFDRAKKNITSFYERQWNNRDKTESAVYADEYIRNFTDEETIPGIDAEFTYVKNLLPKIRLDEVNDVTNLFRNEKNRFSYVMGPDTDMADRLPKPEMIIGMLDAKQQDVSIKPYEEKIVGTVLMSKVPISGKVKSRKVNALLGTTELMLSNGVKVTLKATDFKNDQILLSAYREGGLTNYSLEDKYSAENAASLVSSMGVGEFNPTDLKKVMAGKVAVVTPNISNYTSGFSGSSSKKDIESLFQMFNLFVTEPRKDSVIYRSVVQRGIAQVAMLGANPQIAFIDTLYEVMYDNNPLAPTAVPKALNYEKINLGRALEIYKERLGDVGGMHISIVGSFDEGEVVALLEKYIAGLTSTGKSTYLDNKVRITKEAHNFQFRRGKEEKSLIIGIISGETKYSEQLLEHFNALSDAINIIITEEMREKIQGIYGGGTNISFTNVPFGQYQLVLQLPCGPAKVDTLIAAFNAELKNIATNGLTQGYVDKVKQAWIEKYKVDVKKNEYWLSALQSIQKKEKTAERFLNSQLYFEKLNPADIKHAAEIMYRSSGKIFAVQMPETNTEGK